MRVQPRRPAQAQRKAAKAKVAKKSKPSHKRVPDRITSYDDLSPEILEAVATNLLATAAEAREDIVTFFEFVMKDFTGKVPSIILAPHQKVGLDFMMHHERSVNMWPIGTSKTWIALGLTLFFMGRDSELRGAVVSATEEQAKKIVGLARSYIENSVELRLVFPHLVRSTREGDAWTQTAITVERRVGIKDASLTAYGADSPRIIGSRLNWVIIDDVLNGENTNTKELRDKLVADLDMNVLSRVDSHGWSKVIMINTPWHPEDVIHHARDVMGWACMRMDILGDIEVWDDEACFKEFLDRGTPNPKFGKTWDSPLLRPAFPNDSTSRLCRLVERDPDPTNDNLLWPEVRGWEYIEQQKRQYLPVHFNRLHRCIVRDDATSMCKAEYIEKCLKIARDRGILTMVSEYRGPNLTFTGVDLAISEGEEHDDTAFFTFEARPGGLNVILDIEVGQWDGPTILDKLFQKCQAYNSIVRVENNGCFVPGTRVLTRERGYVPIEQVQVGEHTWTHLGRWRAIKEVLKSEATAVHDARAAGGLPVAATANHWFHLREAARVSGRGNGHMRPTGDPTWVSVGFVDKPSYVQLAVPEWPEIDWLFCFEPITELDALVLGLYMAEGSTTRGQAIWTLNRRETHLAELIEEFAKQRFPKAKVTQSHGDGTLRVTVNSTKLADALRPFGKRREKCLPLDWLGLPLDLRVAMVRGWMLGDGCVLENNSKTDWPTKHFVATTISRNWLMWARTTMIQAGYRPAVAPIKARSSMLKGRKVRGGPAFKFSLNSEDSALWRAEISGFASRSLSRLKWSGRAANSQMVIDEMGVWSRLRNEPAKVRMHDADVYNLVVEEDASFTVEDMIVHNAQEYIRQFALRRDLSIPVKPHTTERRAKVDPTQGIPGLFVEFFNGAWAIPNNMRGEKHPMVKKFIDACLYYTPKRHTFDVLMAAYFAREQKREFVGLSGDPGTGTEGSTPGMTIMSR